MVSVWPNRGKDPQLVQFGKVSSILLDFNGNRGCINLKSTWYAKILILFNIWIVHTGIYIISDVDIYNRGLLIENIF